MSTQIVNFIVYTGFKLNWVMIKNCSSGQYWW